MSQALLPKELMELQLGQVDLLMAMYASDDAVIIDETSLGMVESLRRWCEGVDDGTPPLLTESSIQLVLRLEIPEEEGGPRGESLQLEITFPVVSHDERKTAAETLEEPPKAKIRLRQPDWMSKAETWRLSDDIPGDEDMLTAIDHVRESASRHLQESRLTADVATSAGGEQDGSTDRTWFYFPSISTRSKRQDIVNYAPRYGLTGFLLAGKPGILCLEGGARAIDDYMSFIKTESWGDIPPQHKKVSERYRETGPEVRRVFEGMTEITETMGERRGERANRNDMKALEAWLTEHGVGEAFGKVLI
ncbi:RWD domain-containing protein 2A-like protein [Hapsidospora chrysogenum ATCC 11550]|uniref:RWD domain-containing protein 2A-like protein n=1 Tax=Hapsidospora chrysogenum (strain ATCC 11550 / CBS 779.69 / DSM 880 / IAM 14645 / JCM 23072 / IMI 49137) TaxID=857340 RepID=A0A086T8C1_HAPC1|nr:RWD domain-containing protein 2A-like protein [Hapsidospora chrysogenum ATCC 11550]